MQKRKWLAAGKLAIETAAKQKNAIEPTNKREAVASVKKWAAMSLLKEASMQQQGVDDKASTGSGGIQRSRVAHSPHINTVGVMSQDSLFRSPP